MHSLQDKDGEKEVSLFDRACIPHVHLNWDEWWCSFPFPAKTVTHKDGMGFVKKNLAEMVCPTQQQLLLQPVVSIFRIK